MNARQAYAHALTLPTFANSCKGTVKHPLGLGRLARTLRQSRIG